jgi:hypothetical protein
VTRLAVLCPISAQAFDGVRDYAFRLASHLSAHAPTVLVLGPGEASAPDTPGGSALAVVRLQTWRQLWSRRTTRLCGDPDTWIVQYVPQPLVPRAGLWWLTAWLWYARVVRRHRVVLTVHEFDVPWAASVRRIAGRITLRAVMLLMGLAASRVVVTYEDQRAKLARLLRWTSRAAIAVVPVGSSFAPAGRGRPARERPLSLVMFGQPANMSRELVSALGRWLAGTGAAGARLRWIGRSRDEMLALWSACGLPPNLVEIQDGRSADEVSRLLDESDVCVAPIVDGVSTRRSTVVTALAHALPVVGTDGACTDDLLRQSPACLLTPVGDAGALVRNAALVAGDAARRAAMSQAARTLFDEHLSWDHITGAYLAQLSSDARLT